MSDYRRRSPYEQGELKGSPDRHVKKKKSSKKSKKKSHQLPPEAKPYIHKADDDDDVQIIEAGGHGEEEGGSLTIKPPQAHIPKSEKSHKHKKDRHRSREVALGPGRDRFYGDGKKERYKEFDPGMDNFRDAREIVRERKKEREMKEKEFAREMTKREAKKREESIKERERLERMELERRRERQIRPGDPYEEKESRQLKRKEDRRELLDTKRGREEYQSGDHYRSRSRDQPKSKESSKPFALAKGYPDERGNIKKASNRGYVDQYRQGVEKSESDQDTRRVVVEDSGDQDRRKSKKRDYDKEMARMDGADNQDGMVQDSKSRQDNREDGDELEGAEGESEEDSDSSQDSDSDSSSSGDEDDGSSGEEEDDDEEEEEEGDEIGIGEEGSDREGNAEIDRTDDGRDKIRSKFDDHSDVETPERISDQSRSDDNYMPESPEMSDLEENPEDSLPLYLPAIQGCRSVEEFNCLNRIEEGTYGVVYRALDKKTGEIVALKRLKMEKEKEGFPITSLREINTLLKAQHENIVTVREIVVGSNMDKIYIVMDFVKHDLKSLMENMKNPFLVGEVKTLLRQLLRAVRHMHDNWILHRDLKTSNLLLSDSGILKVGDFGLAREYGSPLRNYTPIVVTLWYRAPELLLGCKQYSTLVDMWSVGCIFAEFLLMKALWPGKSEIDQINKIFKDLGTPTEKIWQGVMELPGMKKVNFNDNPYNVLRNRFGSYFTDSGFNLLNRFLAYDPSKRITADDALVHEYFSESPLPVDPSMFPSWPARSEQTKKTESSPKPPSGGKAYQKLMDDEAILTTAGGFHMGSAAKGVSAQGMGFSLKF